MPGFRFCLVYKAPTTIQSHSYILSRYGRFWEMSHIYIQWPDKYLYLSPILRSKTILIASWVREKGVNDPSYKMRTIFLMSLALSVPIFNKKSHRTQAVETFEVWPNFESFHRSCRMRFFVENWHTKSKGHKKKCSHFIRRRVRPLPLPHS